MNLIIQNSIPITAVQMKKNNSEEDKINIKPIKSHIEIQNLWISLTKFVSQWLSINAFKNEIHL